MTGILTTATKIHESIPILNKCRWGREGRERLSLQKNKETNLCRWITNKCRWKDKNRKVTILK